MMVYARIKLIEDNLTRDMDRCSKLRKAEERDFVPEIDLLPPILHEGKKLDTAFFKSVTYIENIQNMHETYFYSKVLPKVSFRPATTAESISAAAHDFKYLSKLPFDNRFQAGVMAIIPEGVFFNPDYNLSDLKREHIDEKALKSLLKRDRKVNGIYLLDKDMSFAPRDSFTIGIQDYNTFVRGGLARALEHTPEKEARKFKVIVSPNFYKNGVDVCDNYGIESLSDNLVVAGFSSYLTNDEIEYARLINPRGNLVYIGAGGSVLALDVWSSTFHNGVALGVLNKIRDE